MEASKQEKTDNELIAEFMKLDKHPNNQRAYWIEDQDCYLTFDNLQFHHSWNQLMPVVNKCNEVCEKTGYPDDLELPRWHIMSVAKNIKLVHFSVVEFIKWYNSQKPLPL